MKEITLELDDVVYEKAKKQFEELGVDIKPGLVYLIEEFVDENSVDCKSNKRQKMTNNEIQSHKLTKAIAVNLFYGFGEIIDSSYCTFSSRGDIGKSNYNFFWANPNIQLFNNDWYLILNDKYLKKMYLMKIPANSVDKSDVRTRTDKNFLIDLRIQCDDLKFTDLASGFQFHKFLVATINYADFNNMIFTNKKGEN